MKNQLDKARILTQRVIALWEVEDKFQKEVKNVYNYAKSIKAYSVARAVSLLCSSEAIERRGSEQLLLKAEGAAVRFLNRLELSALKRWNS